MNPEILETVRYVQVNMLGRIADEQDNTALMAETAMCHGDHLEIGALHGGSAIVVAILKRKFGYRGSVVCIDPLDGYYRDLKGTERPDPISKVPVSMETICENMRRFRVDLEIIPAKSIPYPLPYSRRFATAYIDGDHWNTTPTDDFVNCMAVVDQFITFDNADDDHPAVLEACKYAEYAWTPYRREGITCIVRHP